MTTNWFACMSLVDRLVGWFCRQEYAKLSKSEKEKNLYNIDKKNVNFYKQIIPLDIFKPP